MSALGSGQGPGVLGSSPALGSPLIGEPASPSLCPSPRLCSLPQINKQNSRKEHIFKKKEGGRNWAQGQVGCPRGWWQMCPFPPFSTHSSPQPVTTVQRQLLPSQMASMPSNPRSVWCFSIMWPRSRNGLFHWVPRQHTLLISSQLFWPLLPGLL